MKKSELRKIITEQIREGTGFSDYGESKYKQNVQLDIDYQGVTHNGHEIEDILLPTITLSFDISIETKSYGIREISIVGIKGPGTVELELEYYESSSEDLSEALIEISPIWSEANIDNVEHLGYFGIDDIVEIRLINDEHGNIIIDNIMIPVQGL